MQAPFRDFERPGRSRVFAANGMAATSHSLASLTAIEVLKSGGNAVDAAIAAAVLQGIAEPQMTGIGGDMFALIKPAGTDDIVALNASGRAPAASSADALRADGHQVVPKRGALAVTIPAAVKGFEMLAERFGRRGLAEALQPAITYADAGIPVAPRVASDWALRADVLTGAARDYYLVDGKAPAQRAMFAAPRQAEVLRRIARDGAAAFYEGEVAEDMTASLCALGGAHTLEDFAGVSADWTDPIAGSYAGVELVEHPPNGQGAIAILILNILKHFDLRSLDPWGVERAHIEAEATKLAYDARNRFLADPAYMTGLDHLMSADTASRLAAKIDLGHAMENPTAVSEEVHRDTIYLTIVDKDRMAVSLIYSIFGTFGAGIASEKFGVLFHNRGSGFNLTPGHPNELAPGKRPMHTIIPAMLKRNGRVVMPFGVMGGPYQATGHARFVTNVLDYGMTPQDAMDAPRCFAEADGLNVEKGYAPDVRAGLAALGHDVRAPETAIGGAQAIYIDAEAGTLEGGSDPRKDGMALGY